MVTFLSTRISNFATKFINCISSDIF